MADVTLYAWNAIEKSELRTPWFWVGATNSSQRAVDGNYGHVTINHGMPDSNPVDASDWRSAGGAAFSWLNREPSSILVEWGVNNFGPNTQFGIAVFLANAAIDWYIELWNGVFSPAPIAQQWYGIGITADSRALTALKAGDLIASAIVFNRTDPSSHVGLDAVRITATYTDTVRNQILWADV